VHWEQSTVVGWLLYENAISGNQVLLLTFRRSKRQYSVNFLSRRSAERLLWDAEQGKQLALQVGELDLEDLQGVCALGQLVPGGEAE
jgi:hypothetical protein